MYIGIHLKSKSKSRVYIGIDLKSKPRVYIGIYLKPKIYLKSFPIYKFIIFRYLIIWTRHIYVRKTVKIRGYSSEPKAFLEQKVWQIVSWNFFVMIC